ncbi:phage holin family protein [Penaeicola halotolerans]|uniref:phage holin family protein n=1 Tax=Penaeicola halotolerans TaxID=2793196 RepID=UPI001CF866FC|nr:phage holin family protein [Penaeicola halotolerans]
MASKTSQSIDILIQLVIAAVAVLITSYILPGVAVDGFLSALILAAFIALMNVTIKPILVILTIPITVFTLGLFLLVINAIIILIAHEVIPGFEVGGFWYALLFSLVLSLINSIFGVKLGNSH